MLARCYQNCLVLSKDCGMRNIAFPAISTGFYLFPVDLTAQISVREEAAFLQEEISVEHVDVG